MIYADNAATTKLDIAAFEAMKPFLLENYANASQPYSFGVKAKRAINEARKTIAKCIGAEPEEIYFTSGGTESDNWAIKMGSKIAKPDGNIITSQIEHHAILHACAALEKTGMEVKYLPVTQEAVVLPESLIEMISEKTSLVSIMMANNEVGSIQPIKELAKIAHRSGALFHTDAVQAVGHIKIDVNELGVDMLSASAHKFNGPKGIGFLYVRKEINIFPYMDGGAQEKSLRAGTENVAAIVGMSVALANNCNEMVNIQNKVRKLEQRLLNQLKINYLFNGTENRLIGNLSISIRNVDGEMLLHRLDFKGICISTGSACDSKNTQISHVLKAMKRDEMYANGTIRISLGKNNSADEVDKICEAINEIVGRWSYEHK